MARPAPPYLTIFFFPLIFLDTATHHKICWSQMATDAWTDKLRDGHVKEALDELRQEASSPSHFLSLGAAYMWTGDFSSALAHFDKPIRTPPRHRSPSDIEFAMAGAAAWCVGDMKLASNYWQRGTKAGYAIGGANTRTSLLLYVAAVLEPQAFSIQEATELLAEKARDRRVKSWPGPIAEFILSTQDEKEVREKAVYKGTGMQPHNNRSPKSWQVDFYRLLKMVASGQKELRSLLKEFQALARVEGSEYLDGINFFYFLRLEEFYLVRQWSSRHAGI